MLQIVLDQNGRKTRNKESNTVVEQQRFARSKHAKLINKMFKQMMMDDQRLSNMVNMPVNKHVRQEQR